MVHRISLIRLSRGKCGAKVGIYLVILCMKYFIPSGETLIEVPESVYDSFVAENKASITIPLKSGTNHTIEGLFNGECDTNELPPLPFILSIFDLNDSTNHDEKYFASFAEMKQAYEDFPL